MVLCGMKQTPIERFLAEAKLSPQNSFNSFFTTPPDAHRLLDGINAYEKEVIADAYELGKTDGVCAFSFSSLAYNSGAEYYEKVFGKTDAAKSEFDGSGVNRQKIDEVGQLRAKETTEYPTKERVEQLINEMHNQPIKFVPIETTFTAQEVTNMLISALKLGNNELDGCDYQVLGRFCEMLNGKINKQI